MITEKRIRLNNIDYYIELKTHYIDYKNDRGILCKDMLCLDDGLNSYYDGHDLDDLIKRIEDNYDYDKVKSFYKRSVPFINNVLFIYDRIPFISGIKVIYLDSNKEVKSTDYVSSDDIKNYR